MTISFTTQPGFADLPNTALAPENVSLGVHVARIASNAGFGISRLEVFIGNYANGETVPLPVSLIDGYQYSLDELTFIWGIQTSVDVPRTGLPARIRCSIALGSSIRQPEP
jgi:hypothetical protein